MRGLHKPHFTKGAKRSYKENRNDVNDLRKARREGARQLVDEHPIKYQH